jgi:hypothetical protein
VPIELARYHLILKSGLKEETLFQKLKISTILSSMLLISRQQMLKKFVCELLYDPKFLNLCPINRITWKQPIGGIPNLIRHTDLLQLTLLLEGSV